MVDPARPLPVPLPRQRRYSRRRHHPPPWSSPDAHRGYRRAAASPPGRPCGATRPRGGGQPCRGCGGGTRAPPLQRSPCGRAPSRRRPSLATPTRRLPPRRYPTARRSRRDARRCCRHRRRCGKEHLTYVWTFASTRLWPNRMYWSFVCQKKKKTRTHTKNTSQPTGQSKTHASKMHARTGALATHSTLQAGLPRPAPSGPGSGRPRLRRTTPRRRPAGSQTLRRTWQSAPTPSCRRPAGAPQT